MQVLASDPEAALSAVASRAGFTALEVAFVRLLARGVSLQQAMALLECRPEVVLVLVRSVASKLDVAGMSELSVFPSDLDRKQSSTQSSTAEVMKQELSAQPDDSSAVQNGLERDIQSFERDFPMLHSAAAGQYVVYFRSKQVGIYPTYDAALQAGFEASDCDAEFLVRKIEPASCELSSWQYGRTA